MNHGKKIQYIKLVNFATWKDCTISLCKGINIISGENATGKSAIPKIFEIIINYFNMSEKKRSHYIRIGETTSIAYFQLFDGTKFKFEFTSKIYNIVCILPDGTFIKDSRECYNKFIRDLGIVYDSDKGVIANMLDDNKLKVLVNIDEKASASLVDILISSPKLENLIDTSKDRIKSLRAKMASSNIHVRNCARDLEKFKYDNLDNLYEERVLLEITDNTIEIVRDFLEIVETVESNKLQEPVSVLTSEELLSVEDIFECFVDLRGLDKDISPVNSDSLHILEDILECIDTFSDTEDVKVSSYTVSLLADIADTLLLVSNIEDIEGLNSIELNICLEVMDSLVAVSKEQDISLESSTVSELEEILYILNSIDTVASTVINSESVNLLQAIYYTLDNVKPIHSRDRLKGSSDTIDTLTDIFSIVRVIEGLEDTEMIKAKIDNLMSQLNIDDFLVCPNCGEVIIEEEKHVRG